MVCIQLCNEAGRTLLSLYSLLTCTASRCRRSLLPKGPEAACSCPASQKEQEALSSGREAGKGEVCEEKALPLMVWQTL